MADAEAARLAEVARQNKAAERRDRMDEVKAKIKSASRKGRAVGLPAMLGVNLNFGPDDEGGEQGPSDTPAAATPEPSTGYVPDGLTKEQYAAIKAKEQKSTNLGAWGSKVGGASGPQRGDLMSQPTIWTDPAKFFREDQKPTYTPAQSDASRPNIYASGESSFEQWQSKLINDLSKKPTPEPTPVVAEEVDPEAAEAKNQEIVQALGAVAAAGAGALVVAGVVEAEAAIATAPGRAAGLGRSCPVRWPRSSCG